MSQGSFFPPVPDRVEMTPRRPLYSLILPTRGPLAKLDAMIASLVATTADPSMVEVVAYIDLDDLHKAARRSIIAGWPGATALIADPKPMGEMTAACIAHARGEYIWLVNDDLVHETNNWDVKVATARAALGAYGAECCLFPDDSILGPMMPCFPMFPRQDALATDFFGCRGFERYGIDAVIAELYGNVLRRLCYVPEWIVRHENLHQPGPETVDLANPINWCAFDHGGRTYFADPAAHHRDGVRLKDVMPAVPAMAYKIRSARA